RGEAPFYRVTGPPNTHVYWSSLRNNESTGGNACLLRPFHGRNRPGVRLRRCLGTGARRLVGETGACRRWNGTRRIRRRVRLTAVPTGPARTGHGRYGRGRA